MEARDTVLSKDELRLICVKAYKDATKVIENWLIRYCGFDPSDNDWQALKNRKV